MIDYTPIFNKMTNSAFNKFIEFNDLNISKSLTKEEYRNILLKRFEEDSDCEKKFQDFYKKTEEAGRKHFYLFKLNTKENPYDLVKEKILENESEENRTFDPIKDNNKFFYKIDNKILTIKKIQIQKSYNFIEDEIIDDILTRKYSISDIHYITFITIDYNKNKIIYGRDSYNDLHTQKQQQKEMTDFFTKIGIDCEKLETLITTKHVDKLKFLSNCLTSSISSKVNNYDSASFKKSKADLEKIRKELLNDNYNIDEIKENNPDYDLQTNILYTAGISASMSKDFSLTNDDSEFYYFTDKIGKPYYFRIKLNIVDGSLVTYSSSITKEEIWDVFRQIN